MSNDVFDSERRALASEPDTWQLALMSPSDLYKFANERGVRWSDGDTVKKLWQVGLLRADVILADAQVDLDGLEFVGESGAGQLIYLDRRQFQAPKNGLGSRLRSLESTGYEVAPFFHRFRFYILLRLASVFEHQAALVQFLLYEPGVLSLAQLSRENLAKWTSSPRFADLVERWNHQAEVAIAVEPGITPRILGRVRFSLTDDDRLSIDRRLEANRSRVAHLIIRYGRAAIDALRSELGRRAHACDSNTNVQTLVRLLRANERLKIRGQLGACMELLLMAEIVRRSAEAAFGANLPEEDEIGPGTWMKGARLRIYGTERVFDAGVDGVRDFFTTMGIDRGVKVRCYVEGKTEAAAIEFAFHGLAGIEVVNLNGGVIEARGRGLAFIESLERDIQQGVFSAVVLDGDSVDNVRAIRTAARQDRMFGRFFVNDPDFEMANFTVDELVSAALELMPSEASDDQDSVRRSAAGARSGSELLSRVSKATGHRLGKGAEWGEALARVALGRRDIPSTTRSPADGQGLLGLFDFLYGATRWGYRRSHAEWRIDPDTGALVKRADVD